MARTFFSARAPAGNAAKHQEKLSKKVVVQGSLAGSQSLGIQITPECLGYAFGVQIPSQEVFGCIGNLKINNSGIVHHFQKQPYVWKLQPKHQRGTNLIFFEATSHNCPPDTPSSLHLLWHVVANRTWRKNKIQRVWGHYISYLHPLPWVLTCYISHSGSTHHVQQHQEVLASQRDTC